MQSSSPEQQAGRDNRSARRRLIRGAFGAPAALTLYSGSVAAASMTCVARRVDQPVSPTNNITTTPNSDIYVRVQLFAKNSGASRSTWVSAAALLQAASLSTAQANVLPTGLPIDGWYCVSAGNNGGSNNSGYSANTAYSSAAMLLINNETPAPVANSYIAMRVDTNGKIVGFTDTAGASVVSRSCWTSFAKTI